jgi:DNA-binding transcriptional MerR regulator
MGKRKIWRNKEVAEMFDITPRLLIDLTEKGLVCADIDEGGRGSTRGYSIDNLFDLGLYQELNRLNLGYRNIRQLIKNLRHHPKNRTGLLCFRDKPGSQNLWWDIITEEEMRSDPDTIVSVDDNIFEGFGCATVVVDLRSVNKLVESKIR